MLKEFQAMRLCSLAIVNCEKAKDKKIKKAKEISHKANSSLSQKVITQSEYISEMKIAIANLL